VYKKEKIGFFCKKLYNFREIFAKMGNLPMLAQPTLCLPDFDSGPESGSFTPSPNP
jgi:hypothetical protein